MTVYAHSLASGLALLLAATAAAAPDAKDPAPPETAAPAAAERPAWAAAPTTTTAPAPAAAATDAATTTDAAAARPAPRPRPRLSTAITSQIAGTVPAWKRPPPGAKPKAPPPPDSPDVVRMAPVIVDAYRIPGAAEKEWMTPRGRDVLLMNQYLSSFDRNVLNRFTLPLIGVSNEARARMMYDEDKRLQDLRWINDRINELKAVDPAAAKELEQVRDATFVREEP